MEQSIAECARSPEGERRARTATAARVVLGLLVFAIAVCAVFGAYLLVDSFAEGVRLADSNAGGADYLGARIGFMLAFFLLEPVVPAVLLGIFAVRPTRSTLVAARVGLAIWWVMWAAAFATVVTTPMSEYDEVAPLVGSALALAAGPAIGSVCAHLIANGLSAPAPGPGPNPSPGPDSGLDAPPSPVS